ncbi:S1C family serine protease [Corallococcus carmarthensis]|uniref:Serine protease n=1 Tax=Corallococcus carmarthensis TaxID=2316728 RepID=A0A3A8JJ62_9BACT|nr:serine protease [Corallococcus carmarthensis]NOK18928.1 trypsin-like peptidase domain-containing protein [Corallococcus carmarthensis]RKG95749.1 serine protease [Corallococcus carmarthensis]
MNRLLLGTPLLWALVSCASAPSQSSADIPVATHTQAPLRVERALSRPEPTPQPTRKAMVRRILPLNVRLVTTEGGKVRRSASGVVIGTEAGEAGPVSYVLTNAHAVEQGDLTDPVLKVVLDRRAESHEYPAEVVATGQVPELDLALLRVTGVTWPVAELAADDEPEPGEDVVVAASPYGRALSISGGMVSQVEWDKETKHPRMLKTDAPIGYGASGGGIFSLETGRLLAIVEGYRTAKVDFEVAAQNFSFDVPMPGETFAAPSAKVRGFLQAKGFGRLLERSADAEGAGPQKTASR